MPSQILPQASADEQSITTLLNLLSQTIQTDIGMHQLANRFETNVDAMKFLAHINKKLGNTKQDEHAAAKLPPALRNFSIIKEKETVAAALMHHQIWDWKVRIEVWQELNSNLGLWPRWKASLLPWKDF